MNQIRLAFAFLFLLGLCPVQSVAQDGRGQQQKIQPEPVALADTLVGRLPETYRAVAKSLLTVTEENQQRWQKLTDDELVINVVRELAQRPEASGFLLAELEKEPSPKLRSMLITSIEQYWRVHRDSQKILEQHASSDPDPDVALKALSELRTIRMQELGRLLEARLATAKKAGDFAGATKLAQEQERRYSWYGELTLPGFLRVPPPVFSVKPEDKPIRVLAFGDFGFGTVAQKQTAAAMVEYHKKRPFDFGITLGDNFYVYGMDSPTDPRWQTQFEQLYGPMGIKIYPSLGNHDYGQADSPAAEILYTEKSPNWRLLAPYYTFTAGAVQFFAIDNINLSEEELMWLDSELVKSRAPWKVVYGHYHIYSATRGDNKDLIERLLPILKKNQVQIYLNGHDHNLQELKPDGGVHFFVSGGGGAELYDLHPYDRSVFKQKVNGFTVLEADAKHFKIGFVGTDGKELYSERLEKAVEGTSSNPIGNQSSALDTDWLCGMESDHAEDSRQIFPYSDLFGQPARAPDGPGRGKG
jgi:tartrate-resistant acid phosphatase type 5